MRRALEERIEIGREQAAFDIPGQLEQGRVVRKGDVGRSQYLGDGITHARSRSRSVRALFQGAERTVELLLGDSDTLGRFIVRGFAKPRINVVGDTLIPSVCKIANIASMMR